jgi:hypothetical protein
MRTHQINRGHKRAHRPAWAAMVVITLLAAGIGVGSLVYAGAQTTTTTFYACLKNGTLSAVNVTAPPVCKGGQQVTWNQQGPAGTNGNTIISGAVDPETEGVVGDFYLNTTTYVLFGPKTEAGWGNGTTLVGSAGDETLTIHSATFTPYMRMGDGDALQHAQYTDGEVYGPGQSPNVFRYVSGTGHDAFFNTPDLTLGSTPMSAVSAEVCYSFTKVNEAASVLAVLGVQDGARNSAFAAEPLQPTEGQCVTLTLDPAVKLVNQPHLVTVLDMKLKGFDDQLDVDGVTYTVRPTVDGDVELVKD